MGTHPAQESAVAGLRFHPGLCRTDFSQAGLGVVQQENTAKDEPGDFLQTQADFKRPRDTEWEERKDPPLPRPNLKGDPRFSREGFLFNQLFLCSELKWK